MDTVKKLLWAILTRLGLVLLGLVMGFLSLELIFRWVYPDPSPKLVNQALQFHDTYGIAFTPNTAGWNTSLRGEYSTYITINSKGLRGEAHDYAKEENTFRILVLGDSFTSALQVPDEVLFTTLLEEQLNRLNTDTKIELINAGVVRYGTTNQLTYFTHEGHNYQPDLVLLMFFTGNDILDNISPAHYKLEDDELVPIDFVYNPNFGTPPWEQGNSFFRKTRNYLYTHSRLYSVMVEVVMYALIQQSPQLLDWFQSVGFTEAARPIMNSGNIYSFLQPPAEAWTMTEALLVALQEQVQAQGSQLLVVIIPDETEVDVEKWETLFTAYPDLFDKTQADDDKPTHRLGRVLEQRAIPYLQLRPQFEAYQQKNHEPLYYKYDGHWTVAGHRLTAQLIYDYIVNRKPYPEIQAEN